MPKNYLITLLAIVFLLYSIVFAIDRFVNAATDLKVNGPPDTQTIEKLTAEFMAKICAGHGGVNCSIINDDASVVCNDGTIDKLYPTIYAIPQCHKTIEDITDQQSDFMAKSGCFQPSEMTCINEQSYQNLYKILAASGLADSELGRNELTQCRYDIDIYQAKNADYKRCLSENNNSQFDLPNDRLVLPVLKAVFCPMFYGNNVSYDLETDLCVCDSGSFMSGGKCTDASLICQEKYGPGAFAQKGNCIKPALVPKETAPTPTIQPKINSAPSAVLKPTYQTIEPAPAPYISTLPEIATEPDNQPALTNPADKPKTGGAIRNIISSIISGIKNILKLL